MDFDPHGAKWRCCCCSLPSGLQILSSAEVILSLAISTATLIHIGRDPQAISWFEVCLLITMTSITVSSFLLILGIHRHRPQFMYPSILVRGLLIIFVQVFGVSTVVSPQEESANTVEVVSTDGWKTTKTTNNHSQPGAPNMALRLVLLVFAMLFITVFIFYCIYLIVRGIRYETAFSRLKDRRASLIQAGMIDPDFGSRRPSNA